MIPIDFIYCRPDTLREAAVAYLELQGEEQSPLFYGGGSEIITMARAGSRSPGAVIDLKSIPECNVLDYQGDQLVIGAAVSLSQITRSRLFPLLATAAGRIADHTNQCRITLGGNLCGTIIYRETSLPLMLADTEVVLYGPKGMHVQPFNRVFNQRMLLGEGEFIAQLRVSRTDLNTPYFHIKKTTNEKIDYPLVNVTALRKEDKLRVAFSGLCPYPFRSLEIEYALNDLQLSPAARVEKVLSLLPDATLTDGEGSGEYRLFVLKNTLLNLLERCENDTV